MFGAQASFFGAQFDGAQFDGAQVRSTRLEHRLGAHKSIESEPDCPRWSVEEDAACAPLAKLSSKGARCCLNHLFWDVDEHG